ncbi:protein-L-isoaspartate(D-aspartate) O-methyltransferase [Candidatus Paracaedibacter symbiosus]|uniref:protein-L-isoaspartate(D-aspartate) O-methyltransferase n=1 Tax=Candidatus Paracaedibacter symbiosus TaxID=244582 RepID=UPI000509B0FE|nr:protein-L-isoaspartate(D-aspartate) O-methyltransferase [Candidatus Paracaedibacter symbiosus]
MQNENLFYESQRTRMVHDQIEKRGVHDPEVLRALKEVPRHLFVPPHLKELAYVDSSLPIGYSQTISQPYIVGFMSEAIQPKPTDHILEIGTGCGYQAAVLSRLCQKVFTIEIIEPLAQQAQKRLKELGYTNIEMRQGDGYAGWPEAAPFDAIILTAAPEKIPDPLLQQLKVGGRIVLPVGNYYNQKLLRLIKTEDGFQEEELIAVQFVPMTGQIQK